MLAVGTTVWGVLFFLGALIASVLAVRGLVKIWREFARRVGEASEKGTTRPSVEAPIILTLVISAVYIVAVTLAWNAIQDVTTSMSGYKSQAEVAEQRKVRESQPPTREDLDKTRAELKVRAEVKPHEDALDSFDAKMKTEAEKIRKRSTTTEPAAASGE